jgi:hypothetical protein
MIDENKRSFYAEFTDYDESQCDDWIKENVINHLRKKGTHNLYMEAYDRINKETSIVGTRSQIKEKLEDWLSIYDEVELVSDVCHYDMVLFIDLFGTAFDLPQNVNPACHDINQDIGRYYEISEKEAFDFSREELLQNNAIVIEGDKHNSLYDAKVIKTIYEIIKSHGLL